MNEKMKTNNPEYSENKIKKGDTLQIYTDGASRGNPGPSAYAFIFVRKSDEKVIHKDAGYLGKMTNNKAEYKAVIKALEIAEAYYRSDIEVYSDSELVIKQINKEYRIKHPELQKLCDNVYSLRERYGNITFANVPRDNPFIKMADKMCNDILNKQTGKSTENTKQ